MESTFLSYDVIWEKRTVVYVLWTSLGLIFEIQYKSIFLGVVTQTGTFLVLPLFSTTKFYDFLDTPVLFSRSTEVNKSINGAFFLHFFFDV